MTDEARARRHTISVDTRCYPISAVHKALYALSSVADSELHFADDHSLELTFYPKAADALRLETSFRQLLADFTIQVQVNAETSVVREALVTAALAECLSSRGIAV